MSTTWHKTWHDLTLHKARTALAVLSTVVGVFALGLVFGASGVIRTNMAQAHRAGVPAHITFWGGPFDEDTVAAIGGQRDIGEATMETVASIRWKLEGDASWQDGELVARRDYGPDEIRVVRLEAGMLPGRHTLAVEGLSSQGFGLPIGTTILVEQDKRLRRVPIVGIVGATVEDPPQWGGHALFFATPETLDWLTGEGQDGNRLYVRLKAYDRGNAEQVALRIKKRIEGIGLEVQALKVTDPDRHPWQDMLDAIMAVLALMGVLSLALSGFLVTNTMSALIAQQIWQIGVMKAIGATFWRVARVYLATALIYGLLSLAVALPLGMIGAYWLARWLLAPFNVELLDFQIHVLSIGIQLAVGLGVPLLAAAVPVIDGARITVRRAISSQGTGAHYGSGVLDRAISSLRFLPRPIALSLRNAFRRRARVALTLGTLVLSGAMFVMALSAGDSFALTVDSLMMQVGQDVSVALEEPHDTSRLAQTAEAVPGVAYVEVWHSQPGTILLAGDIEHPVLLQGVPAGSRLFRPRVLAGRTLSPDDHGAVLISGRLASEQGLTVGDRVSLHLHGKDSTWMVVGLYPTANALSDELYVPLETLSRVAGTFGRGNAVMVVADGKGGDAEVQLVEDLRATYEAQKLHVSATRSASRQLQESQSTFATVTYLLLAMAILTAIVGGIGLMGTMSINVVERSREIGIMRAIGASSAAIAGIFVAEGVLLGGVSWALATLLSYPSARYLGVVIGDIVLRTPLDFSYHAGAPLIWLAIVLILSAAASLWPALGAARVSVRQALAYE